METGKVFLLRHEQWIHIHGQKIPPDAKICIDPFHVVKHLNDMADGIRLRYQCRFQDDGDAESLPESQGHCTSPEDKEAQPERILGEHAIKRTSRSSSTPLRFPQTSWKLMKPSSSSMKS